KTVSLPARFEKLNSDPVFIADGAHTPQSIGLCAETFCQLFGNRGILLFACAADKDYTSMAGLLLPRFSRCIITSPGNFKASNPGAVYEAFRSAAKTRIGTCVQENIFYAPDTFAAIDEALKTGKEKSLPILGCGSFYLAAEIRKCLKIKL
ncbi:MAG: tetrahydrofolate synthase, partial [Treponema sp.]|nr:tetrahydrofolate synthase [Treponema sp.]